MNWSKTWLAEVGTDGWFSLSIATPETDDMVPSNTFFEVRPSLSRRGPIDTDASSSEDRTVVLTPTRFLHDTILPQVNSLMALDAGRETPSDGHVSMYGKDVALRLRLSDPEGLASQLEVWTWLERIHDTNGNGVMEQGEYRQQTVSLNRGVSEMEVDLPLLSSLSVVPDSKNTGKISVVLVGEDLAGNALEEAVGSVKTTIWLPSASSGVRTPWWTQKASPSTASTGSCSPVTNIISMWLWAMQTASLRLTAFNWR